ncbi:outer membrane protein assembly factor BamC [Thiomicrospira microaerophila]|uniref:outer membrane protein assembly factor BamC n=1 Tax=Thiomicrospira microaerophila TaxID=406020 RepID=UPI000698A55F|nr:outer membrane protein assembly factor BamC [Thiomicrospira microaerophila]
MIFNKRFKLFALAGLSVSLVGCSGLSKWVNGDDDYRLSQSELAKQLETPPNFVLRRAADPLLSLDVATHSAKKIDSLPAIEVDGISLGSNLHQRWLVLEELSADQAWHAVERFLVAQGFKIDQQRPELGLITTQYLARSEVAPTEQELGRISRLLNSWRPELAKGVYDRLSVQLVSEQDQVLVYFYHHMMLADSSSDTTRWTLRPYEPMMENLMLYRALLFFGMQQNTALSQIESTAYYQEVVEGEAFMGLMLNAPISQAWDYLQAMQYRADWQVESSNVRQHELWVKTPKIAAQNQGFFARLFGRSSQPDLVKLSLSTVEAETSQTRLTLTVQSGETSLKAEQRRQILEALGLLTE